jgi:hypothetical protein
MKKTKDDIIKNLEQRLKNCDEAANFFGGLFICFFISTIVLGIALDNNVTILDKRTKYLNYLERENERKERQAQFEYFCDQLERESGINTYYYNLECTLFAESRVEFTSVKEIQQAIRHYQLGEKREKTNKSR